MRSKARWSLLLLRRCVLRGRAALSVKLPSAKFAGTGTATLKLAVLDAANVTAVQVIVVLATASTGAEQFHPAAGVTLTPAMAASSTRLMFALSTATA